VTPVTFDKRGKIEHEYTQHAAAKLQQAGLVFAVPMIAESTTPADVASVCGAQARGSGVTTGVFIVVVRLVRQKTGQR
jgi:hypothetical protein